MIERQLVVPVPAPRLWQALTDPEKLAAWFGASVAWELRPGAPACFDEPEGSRRQGLVTEVVPGRRLAFRWWDADEGDGPSSSEVAYELEPDGDGTRLVVTERRVAGAPEAEPPAGPEASAAVKPDVAWTDWDGRLLGVWAQATQHAWAGVGR